MAEKHPGPWAIVAQAKQDHADICRENLSVPLDTGCDPMVPLMAHLIDAVNAVAHELRLARTQPA